jgi:hypothetical protein
MDRSDISTGAATACGRLDAFVRLTGPELGRWMLEMAMQLAERGRRLRTADGTARRGSGGGGSSAQ